MAGASFIAASFQALLTLAAGLVVATAIAVPVAAQRVVDIETYDPGDLSYTLRSTRIPGCDLTLGMDANWGLLSATTDADGDHSRRYASPARAGEGVAAPDRLFVNPRLFVNVFCGPFSGSVDRFMQSYIQGRIDASAGAVTRLQSVQLRGLGTALAVVVESQTQERSLYVAWADDSQVLTLTFLIGNGPGNEARGRLVRAGTVTEFAEPDGSVIYRVRLARDIRVSGSTHWRPRSVEEDLAVLQELLGTIRRQ